MIAVLPLIFLVLVVLVCRVRGEGTASWTTCLVLAATFWGAGVVAISEFLSLVSRLDPTWVAIAWSSILVGAVGVLVRREGWKAILEGLRGGRGRLLSQPTVFLLPLAILSVALLLTAVLSPPNTTDSLRYHMPRVLHWAQNRSLAHYATSYQPQLWNPPWAEMAILHLRLLWGSDRLANLVQWISMLGSLVVVAGIARLLGSSKLGQAASVAFAFSLPMGILQATSTQTDYVTAFWLICTAYLVVLSKQRPLGRPELISLGMAVGLGMLSKATFYIYAIPFVTWYVATLLRRSGWRQTIVAGSWVTVPALLINAGHWARNVTVFGGLFGSAEWVRVNTNVGTSGPIGAEFLSSLFKSLAGNFASPSETFNYEFWEFVIKLDRVLGVDSGGYALLWGWNHEDIAGNPLHIGLVAVTLFLLMVFRPWRAAVWQYALAALAGFLLLALTVSYGAYGVRFQLPFFIAWAPLYGVSLGAIRARWPAVAATTALLSLSIPWILFNSTRPLIGLQPDPKGLELPCILGCTAVGSILEVPEEDLLFANWRSLAAPSAAITEKIEEQGCRQVGLRIDSIDMEYPFWWLLGAPNSGVRIETLHTFPRLESLKDPEFEPCAIICTICKDQKQIHGMTRTLQEGGWSLYIGGEYSPRPNG